jgi:hypothetical protein
VSTQTAVLAGLGAALLFGMSSVADQRSTKRVQIRPALSPRILLDLARQPLWLTAIAANVAGFALQIVALASGSLALVQPLLVGDLVCAVLIARYVSWRAHREIPGGRRTVWAIFAGVGAASAGVAGFLVVGQPTAGRANVSYDVLVPLAAGLVVVVGG